MIRVNKDKSNAASCRAAPRRTERTAKLNVRRPRLGFVTSSYFFFFSSFFNSGGETRGNERWKLLNIADWISSRGLWASPPPPPLEALRRLSFRITVIIFPSYVIPARGNATTTRRWKSKDNFSYRRKNVEKKKKHLFLSSFSLFCSISPTVWTTRVELRSAVGPYPRRPIAPSTEAFKRASSELSSWTLCHRYRG